MDNFGEPRERVDFRGGPITPLERLEAVERLLKALYIDSERDWVSHVLRERLLADLHTRMLREAPAGPRARVNSYLQAHAGAPVSAEP